MIVIRFQHRLRRATIATRCRHRLPRVTIETRFAEPG
jgi:hypothetical protein